MKDAHLTPADIDRLASDKGERVLNRVFLHHLAVCPDCHRVGGFILDAYLTGDVPLDLPGHRIELAQSRFQAPQLWEQLKDLDLKRKKTRFESWGLAELLCRHSAEALAHDPAAAIRIAELAVEIAMLVSDHYPDDETWVNLLRGLAWAHLGHARRVFGDLREAWQDFERAEDLWGPAFADAGDVLGYKDSFLALTARAGHHPTEF